MSPTDPSNPSGARPGKADWRNKAKAPTVGGRPPSDKGITWREKHDVEYLRAKRRHRMKLAGLLFGSVALMAWLFFLYIYPNLWRRTPFFAVVITPYAPSADPLGYSLIPPNGWAQEDADRFELLTQQKIADYSRVEYALWETTKDGFQYLRERIGASRRKALIVYLSVHGAVNKDGHACLIPPGASPLDSQKWMSLDEVLLYLFPKEDWDRLPKKKLVILDCNRMDANWGMGLLYNGFADDLDRVRREVGVPGLVILNSTSPGQVGGTSPERFQGSAFGYFVWRGLIGAADRRGEGNGDGEVSLRELHQYVSKYVRRWAQESRADAQTPMLVAEPDEDFPLVRSKTEKELAEIDKEWAPPPLERDVRWSKVAELWAKHAELEKTSPWRTDPLRWERFQHGLLRLEQLLMAGGAYREEFEKCQAALVDLAQKLGEDPLAPALRAYTLPLASRLAGDSKVDAESKRLRALWAKAPGKFAAEPGRQPSYVAAATAAWGWCLEHPEGQATSAGWSWPDELFALMEKARSGRKPHVVEWHFVRMLHDYLDSEVHKARPDLVKASLATRHAAEAAAVPQDERVHYWLHGLVDAADQQRRLAEDWLFVGSPEAMVQSAAGFTAAVGQVGRGGFAEARARAEKVSGAFALRDRAWARTPYLAQWVTARLNQGDPALAEPLAKLIQATRDLGSELDGELAEQALGWGASPSSGVGETLAGAAPQPTLAALTKATGDVDTALRALEGAYERERVRLSEPTGTGPEIVKQIGTLLSVPLVTGRYREALRNRWLDNLEPAERSGRGTSRLGEAGADVAGTGSGVAAAKKSLSPEGEGEFVRRLTQWDPQPHPALAVLSRTGLQEGQATGARSQGSGAAFSVNAGARAPAAPGDSDRAVMELRKRSLARQGDEIRRLLAATGGDADALVQLTEARLRADEPAAGQTRSGLSKADRLLRASAGMWQTELAPWTDPDTDPVTQLRRLDLRYLLLWQAKRTLDDFWGPARNDPAEPSFFDVVAAEYLASAKELVPKLAIGGQGAVRARYGESDLTKLLADRRAAIRDPAAEPVRAAVAADVQVVPGDPAAPVEATISQSKGLPTGKAAVFFETEADRQVLTAFGAAADVERAASGLRRGWIDVPGDAGKGPCWVRSSDFRVGPDQAPARNCLAVALYRGHVVEAPFIATGTAGLQIVYQPPVDPKTYVTVKGTQKAESYVVFILDYSGSMNKLISPDTLKKQAPNKGGRHRYEDARETLLSILAKLAKVPGSPFRIGLFVYGHRVNWSSVMKDNGFTVPPDAELVKRNPKNPSQLISADADHISPSEDVQWIWPAAWPATALSEADVRDVRATLKPLLPMSETPLYFAIMKAIDRLNEVGGSPGGPAPSRHIVVITDGINYQYEHKVGKADAAEKFAKTGKGIRLDIIGYSFDEGLLEEAKGWGMTPDDVRRAVDDLKALARNHGGDQNLPPAERGEFHPALDASSLEMELERSLRLSRFVVLRDDAASGGGNTPTPMDLGESQPIALSPTDQTKPGGVPFTVKVVGSSGDVTTKIALEGGEAIELHLSDDAARLEHARYDTNLRASRSDVPDPLDPSRRLFIAAHEPPPSDDDVHFSFSIQNNEAWRFSPRPAEAWVEIRPLLLKDPETAPLYVFYDEQFQLESPVPILECTARHWPKEAVRAEVRLWCKFTRTPADTERRLDQWTPKTPWALRAGPDAKLPDVTLDIDHRSDEKQGRHNVIITERYHRGDAGLPSQLNALKIEMVPRPITAVHEYIRAAGVVRHTFSYAIEPFRSGQIPPYLVRVTTRDAVVAVDRAVTIGSPLSVDITPNTARAR